MINDELTKEIMLKCVQLARESAKTKQYPIAAIVTNHDGTILSMEKSNLRQGNDPTNHPEIDAIRGACKKLDTRFLRGCYLYTTLEPCPMCTSAAIWARMQGIVYGAYLEDIEQFIVNNPARKFSWRQIPIKARDIIKFGTPSLEVYEGVLREECMQLFC